MFILDTDTLSRLHAGDVRLQERKDRFDDGDDQFARAPMDQQSTAPSSSQPRGRGRGGRFLLLIIAAIAAVAVGVFSYRYISSELAVRRAEADLRDALAEVDATEPNGWRWPDLEAQRAQVPDDKNGSKLVVEAARLLPKDWKDDAIFDDVKGLPPPARMTDQQAEALREVLQRVEPALVPARKLVGFPRGRFPPLPLSRDVFSAPATHLQEVRDVGTILYCEALRCCQDRADAKAWAAAVATLHAGRSVGDEPLFMAQLVRMSMQALTVEALERILAHGEMDTATLQRTVELLQDEIRQPLLTHGIRGERASQHLFYANLASGETDLRDIAKWTDETEWDRSDPATQRTVIAGSHAYMLRALSKALACTKKADVERNVCFQEWDFNIKDDKGRNRVPPLAAVLTPAVPRVAAAETRYKALLACAVTCMAAERYRMRQKRWPQNLNELVSEALLPKVPVDPYDGQPLRLRQSADGLVVFAIGAKKDYQGDAWDNLDTPPDPRMPRVEFRLWNPDRRRQAPVPPRVHDGD